MLYRGIPPHNIFPSLQDPPPVLSRRQRAAGKIPSASVKCIVVGAIPMAVASLKYPEWQKLTEYTHGIKG